MNKQERQAARQSAQDDPEFQVAAQAVSAYREQFAFELGDISSSNPAIWMIKSGGAALWPHQQIAADAPRYLEDRRLFKVMVAARNAAQERLISEE